MAAGFTTFAATSLVAQDYKNHITLITMNEDQPQMPKIWLISDTVDSVVWSDHFEVLPNDVFK